LFDVTGVSVSLVYAKRRELSEQSGLTRASIELLRVREARKKTDLCWEKIFLV
jgi:hypothetical protein